MSAANGKGKLRFAALRRVSTEQQEKYGESLRTQTISNEKSVTSLNGIIAEWYGGQEHATPGHEKQEIARLIADAKKKRFDAIIVTDPDRWSRDNTVSREGLEIFRENGIRFFIGTTEKNLFNTQDILFLSLSAVIGEYFARNQMEKSFKNRIDRAKRGVPTGGKLPFGRIFERTKDRQDGKWKVDEKKKLMIQDCAKRYIAGESMKDLANEHGIKLFNLHKVLTKVSGPKWQLEFKSKVLNIHEVVEMEIPELLDDKTIRAIKARVQANRTYTHGHIKYRYLFSRMISCDHCGYAMFGQTNHNGFRYYRHAHAARDRACPGAATKCWVPAERVEDAAMRHLFDTFGNPAGVKRAIEEATPNDDRIKTAFKRLEFLEKELEKVKASRKRVLDLDHDELISKEDANERLRELKERETKFKDERERLEKELAHIPTQLSVVRQSEEVVKHFRRYTNSRAGAKGRLANAVLEEMSYEDRRQLCQTVFNGKTAEGKRMGIWITWDETGKKWNYRMEGHLVDAIGPANENGHVFGVSADDGAVVTKCSKHSRGKVLPARRCG